jgi:hypothetical protein
VLFFCASVVLHVGVVSCWCSMLVMLLHTCYYYMLVLLCCFLLVVLLLFHANVVNASCWCCWCYFILVFHNGGVVFTLH